MPLINQISIPRFDSLLAKLFGLKERSVAPSVATEIVPTIGVDTQVTELYYVRGERILSLSDTPIMWGATVSAVTDVIAFGNPLGSNTLITLEEMMYYPAPDVVNYRCNAKLDWSINSPFSSGFGGVGVGFPATMNPADWNVDFSGVWRDSRWFDVNNLGGNLGHVLQYWVANKVGATDTNIGSLIWSGASAISSGTSGAAYQPFEWKGEVVLHPGSCMIGTRTFCDPISQVIKFQISWRERPLEDAEIRAGSS